MMMSIRGLATLTGLALATCGAPTSDVKPPAPAKPEPNAESAPVDITGPTVTVLTAPEYLRGFPIMVAIEVANLAPDEFFYRLPLVGWYASTDDARWIVRTADGDEVTLNDGFIDFEQEGGGGFNLGYEDRYVMLLDLSAFGVELPAGEHQVQVGYPVEDFVASAWTPLKLVDPSAADAALAKAALMTSSGDDSSWMALLEDGTATPDFSGLSERARRRVALLEFLREVLHGPVDLAAIDPAGLDAIAGGPLDGEREVLRYELLHARAQPDQAALQTGIERSWPGLAWRLDEVDEGRGFLLTRRDWAQARRAYHEGR